VLWLLDRYPDVTMLDVPARPLGLWAVGPLGRWAVGPLGDVVRAQRSLQRRLHIVPGSPADSRFENAMETLRRSDWVMHALSALARPAIRWTARALLYASPLGTGGHLSPTFELPQQMRVCPLKVSRYDANHVQAFDAACLQGLSRKLACDDKPLDLRRAFPDLINLGVTVPFLDGEVAAVTVATQDLDCVIGHPHGHVARL
jgi:hypothetical protein